MGRDLAVEAALKRPGGHGGALRGPADAAARIPHAAAVAQLTSGFAAPEIAPDFGIGPAGGYLRWAIAGPADAPAGDGTAGDAVPRGAARRGGRPEAVSAASGPALPPGHAAALREILLGERAEPGGAAPADPPARRLWTIEAVRTRLAQEFGVRTTADGAQAAMRALGLWPDRPPRRPHRIGDAAWVATELPRLRERAAAEGARLYLVEDTPVGDGALWLFTAAPVYGPRRFALYDPAREGGDHAAFLIDFLGLLAPPTGPPVHVVLEPPPAPGARAVTALAAASQGRLRVHFLPDTLARLERLAALWRAALEAARHRARERDAAARDHRDAKAAEERLRLERDRAIRGCREAGVPVTELVEHTGLAPKTIYDALDRTAAPGPAEAVPAAERRRRLARLDAAVAAWRRAAEAARERARAREEAVAAYRAARTAEERLRRHRDDAIAAWRAAGAGASAIAARTGVSVGLVSQIASRRPAAEDAVRHGAAGRLLAELERAGKRWREAVAATEERARARREAVDACRAARAAEARLRARRDRVILACHAAAIPAPDIAQCAGIDVSTVYQTLRVHRPAVRELPRLDRLRLLSRLREVSHRWRRAAEAVRERVRLRDEAIRAWRQSRADEEAARRLRDRAIAECRAAGIGVSVLAACTRLDLSTVYAVCQAAGA